MTHELGQITEPLSDTAIIAGDEAANLVRVTGKAILKLEQIIDMKLPKADTDPSMFIKLVAEQRQAAAAIIATQVRVDENMLRHRSDDMLERLLATVEQKVAKQRLVN